MELVGNRSFTLTIGETNGESFTIESHKDPSLQLLFNIYTSDFPNTVFRRDA